MPSSPQTLEHLHIRLRMAKDRQLQDKILDIILENETHATEWDAIMWGFPARWMRNGLRKLGQLRPCRDCGRDH